MRMIAMNELQLDNMDTSNVKDVAYYIWLECEHVDDGNVMSNCFYNSCRDLAQVQFPNLPFNEIWEEIESYMF